MAVAASVVSSSGQTWSCGRPIQLSGSSEPRLLVVVDTEEEFDWRKPFNRQSTEVGHLQELHRLQSIFERHGIIPVYAIDYPVAESPIAQDIIGPLVASGKALLGAHLHPWVCPPFVEDVNDYNSFHGNLHPAVEREKLARLTERIELNFGERPQLFRAGRHGLGPNTFSILNTLGYTIDLSPRPLFNESRFGGCDYRAVNRTPLRWSPDFDLVSIPTTTGLVGLLSFDDVSPWMRKLLCSNASSFIWTKALLSKLRLLSRVELRPEGYTLKEMKRLTSTLLGCDETLFHLTFHSPTIVPGNTPYTRSIAERDAFLDKIDRFLDYFINEESGIPSTPNAILSESWRPHLAA